MNENEPVKWRSTNMEFIEETKKDSFFTHPAVLLFVAGSKRRNMRI